MNKSSEEKDFITFDDLEFIYPLARLAELGYDVDQSSAAGFANLKFDNELRAKIIKTPDSALEKGFHKYFVELYRDGVDGNCVSFKLTDEDTLTSEFRLNTDNELCDFLTKASQVTENDLYVQSIRGRDDFTPYKEYINSNNVKDFTNIDDLEFIHDGMAIVKLDNELRAEITKDWQERGYGKYYVELYRDDVDGNDVLLRTDENTLANKFSLNTDNELCDFLTKASQVTENDLYVQSIHDSNDYIPYKEYINRNNEAEDFITIDDLEFIHPLASKGYDINPSTDGGVANLKLDNELRAEIMKSSDKMLEEGYSKYNVLLYRDGVDGNRVSFKLTDEDTLTDLFSLNTDNELCDFLTKASQVTENDLYVQPIRGRDDFTPYKEYINRNNDDHNDNNRNDEPNDSKDKVKQSLDRIRTKKKSVSGVYVADKIAEAMRSGVLSEPVTPEKGKQLSDNIKKKYIMDQQQKS